MEIPLNYCVFFHVMKNKSFKYLKYQSFSVIYSNVSMYSSSEKTMAIIMMTENDKNY